MRICCSLQGRSLLRSYYASPICRSFHGAALLSSGKDSTESGQKIENNSSSSKSNRVVFLHGEPITTQTHSVLKRLDRMRYRTWHLDGGFLKWLAETHNVTNLYEWGNQSGALEQARAVVRQWNKKWDNFALNDAQQPDYKGKHIFVDDSPISGLIYHPLLEEVFDSEYGVEWLREFRGHCGGSVTMLLCECISEHEAAFRLAMHKFENVERDELLTEDQYNLLYRVFAGKTLKDEFDCVKTSVGDVERLSVKYGEALTGQPWDKEHNLLHTIDAQQGTCALLEDHCGIKFELPSFVSPWSSKK